jgi:succinate dehydrogenase / fumarate reductase, membrane anchor subunit
MSATHRTRGAAGHGAGHFIAVRVTSIVLALLAPWFVVNAALSMRDGAYASVIDFLSDPFNAVGVILLLAVSLYHMMLGMQDVILDYFHNSFNKMALMVLNTLVPLGLGAGAIFALLAVNFGA